MLEVTRAQVTRALRAVGIQPGDGLLVHSAIQYLGKPIGGPGIYHAALQEVLGPRGTIAVPTFNFAFGQGEAYDPQTTPSDGMGVFSEYIRQLPGTLRTPHPMQSLAVTGRYAADLAQRDTPSAFDPGSAFERMLELDFKLLLLGASIQAVSMLHYSEQRAGVPYRYWKDFSGPIRTPQGWETRTYRMYVRDLDIDPHIELYEVQKVLEIRGQWAVVPLNYGTLSYCRLADFVLAVDEFLARDPWSLVVNRPKNSG